MGRKMTEARKANRPSDNKTLTYPEPDSHVGQWPPKGQLSTGRNKTYDSGYKGIQNDRETIVLDKYSTSSVETNYQSGVGEGEDGTHCPIAFDKHSAYDIDTEYASGQAEGATVNVPVLVDRDLISSNYN